MMARTSNLFRVRENIQEFKRRWTLYGRKSRRDGTIVAWHEVPGNAPPQKEPSGSMCLGASTRPKKRRSKAGRLTYVGKPSRLAPSKPISIPSLRGHRDWIPLNTYYGTVLMRAAFPGTSCQATIGCPSGTGCA
jgi:hypothetical protein